MQLKFDFGDDYYAPEADTHVCPACQQRIELLQQELTKLHAYLRVMNAKRKPKG